MVPAVCSKRITLSTDQQAQLSALAVARSGRHPVQRAGRRVFRRPSGARGGYAPQGLVGIISIVACVIIVAFVIDRRLIAERGVATMMRIVPALVVVKDRHAYLTLSFETAAFEQLAFRGGEKVLRRRVVETITYPRLAGSASRTRSETRNSSGAGACNRPGSPDRPARRECAARRGLRANVDESPGSAYSVPHRRVLAPRWPYTP
jgi:hypothetical protein